MTVIDYLAQDLGSVVVQLAKYRAENDLLRTEIAEKGEEIVNLKSELAAARSLLDTGDVRQ